MLMARTFARTFTVLVFALLAAASHAADFTLVPLNRAASTNSVKMQGGQCRLPARLWADTRTR
jgi:hypothetical protein